MNVITTQRLVYVWVLGQEGIDGIGLEPISIGYPQSPDLSTSDGGLAGHTELSQGRDEGH